VSRDGVRRSGDEGKGAQGSFAQKERNKNALQKVLAFKETSLGFIYLV
jgi:hypothetical protein